MGDSDSGIGIDSGITLIFSHFGIGIGIKSLKNRNQVFFNRLESESESESNDLLESESEPGLRLPRNRPSLVPFALKLFLTRMRFLERKADLSFVMKSYYKYLQDTQLLIQFWTSQVRSCGTWG